MRNRVDKKLQTDRPTDRQTDGPTDKLTPIYPPNRVLGVYSTLLAFFAQVREPRRTNLSAANLLYRYRPRKRSGRVTTASENIGQLHSRR